MKLIDLTEVEGGKLALNTNKIVGLSNTSDCPWVAELYRNSTRVHANAHIFYVKESIDEIKTLLGAE